MFGQHVHEHRAGACERDHFGRTAKVKAGTNTASPGPICQALSASDSASVPLAQLTACFTPANAAEISSSSRTCGPRIHCPPSTAAWIARASGSPRRILWACRSMKGMDTAETPGWRIFGALLGGGGPPGNARCPHEICRFRARAVDVFSTAPPSTTTPESDQGTAACHRIELRRSPSMLREIVTGAAPCAGRGRRAADPLRMLPCAAPSCATGSAHCWRPSQAHLLSSAKVAGAGAEGRAASQCHGDGASDAAAAGPAPGISPTQGVAGVIFKEGVPAGRGLCGRGAAPLRRYRFCCVPPGGFIEAVRRIAPRLRE